MSAAIPWQPRPDGDPSVVWRSSANPIIRPGCFDQVLGVFNSAVVPFEDRFAGVFRVETRLRFPKLHAGFSNDGVNWDINPQPLRFETDVAERPAEEYAYDPRVTTIDGRHYVTWCAGDTGPTIGIAWTEDFQTYHRTESAFLPFNRNGVLFPKKIDGYYWMLSRPSDDGHTPFGDIFISRSPDLTHWGHHRCLMKSGGLEHGVWWQSTKIGAGAVPIETAEGWLILYHGVMGLCNGFEYSMGAALLDLEQPWKVRYRARRLLLTPEAPYETTGHVAGVVFPCAALVDESTGRIAIYYGAADTTSCLAYSTIDAILDWTMADSVVY